MDNIDEISDPLPAGDKIQSSDMVVVDNIDEISYQLTKVDKLQRRDIVVVDNINETSRPGTGSRQTQKERNCSSGKTKEDK